MDVENIRDFLNISQEQLTQERGVGSKTLYEILHKQKELKEKFAYQIGIESTGYLWWKCRNDSYNYGILLKDGTVILAAEVKEKDFGWVDIFLSEIEIPDLVMFGKNPSKFSRCRNLISVRIEHIAAICELES